MNDGTTRTVVVIFAVVLVFLGGVAIASFLTGSSSASPTPVASASGSTASATAGPSESSVAAVTPSPTAKAPSSPAPSSSQPPTPLATVTFRSLKLDPKSDPDGQARLISFTTDGPGSVTAKLTSHSAVGTTHMCLRLGSTDLLCQDRASTTIIGTTKQQHGAWRVSLLGNGKDAPVVDLTLTFQAIAPKVTIAHARFDGTDATEYNGIIVAFVAGSDGQATLAADWGGHPFVYEVDLFNETTATSAAALTNQGPATSTNNSFPVTANDRWRLVLQNTETGFGRTDMTATITWPGAPPAP